MFQLWFGMSVNLGLFGDIRGCRSKKRGERDHFVI